MLEIKCYLDEKSLIINTETLAKLLNVGVRQIQTYLKKGMPKNKNSSHKKNLFDVIECYKWARENVDKSKSPKIENFDIVEVKEKREVADMQKAQEQAKIEKLKRLQLEGSLVDKDDTDKALSELGATMVSYYRNDLKALPVLLEKKSMVEIKKELNNHYKDRLEDMTKIVSKEIKPTDLTVYDKLFEWIKGNI